MIVAARRVTCCRPSGCGVGLKFETTPQFDRDYKTLPKQHRQKFRSKAFPQFHDAAENGAAGADAPWPKGLRLKRVKDTKAIWEMTWSTSDPDGRVTWEWVDIEGKPGVRWRRIGTHAIFSTP